MQIRTTRYYYTPNSMTKIWNTDNTTWWRGCGVTGISYIAGGNAKWYSQFGTVWWFLTKLNIPLPYNPAIVLFSIYPKVLKT